VVIMRALDRKLLRNLREMKGQAIAIALVIGCGVAMSVMSLSTLRSLHATRQTYYGRVRFGDRNVRIESAAIAPPHPVAGAMVSV